MRGSLLFDSCVNNRDTHTQVHVVLLIALSVIPLIFALKNRPVESALWLRCSKPALSAVDTQSTQSNSTIAAEMQMEPPEP